MAAALSRSCYTLLTNQTQLLRDSCMHVVSGLWTFNDKLLVTVLPKNCDVVRVPSLTRMLMYVHQVMFA